MSATAHNEEPGAEEIAFSAISALANIEDLDERTRLAYDDIIRGSLNEIAKVALEKFMQERGREYISDFAKHYYGQGLEKGREEGLKEPAQGPWIYGFQSCSSSDGNCHDVRQFKTWAKRAVQVDAIEEIFPELADP